MRQITERRNKVVMKKNECTILVMGCDEYVDVLELNAIFKERYWKGCPFEYVLVTQTITPENNVYDKIIKTSKDTPWMQRLEMALKEVKTPFVCIMCDDYFYSQKVSEKFFYDSIEKMKENNIGLLKIVPTNFFRQFKIIDRVYKEYKKDNAFRISYYPSIWNVEYLKKFSGSGYSVWEAERKNSVSSKAYQEKIWTVRKNELKIVHAIMAGCWTRETIQFFRREKIESKLYASRKVKSIKMYLKDAIYNILMTIAPDFILNMQETLKIGRH